MLVHMLLCLLSFGCVIIAGIDVSGVGVDGGIAYDDGGVIVGVCVGVGGVGADTVVFVVGVDGGGVVVCVVGDVAVGVGVVLCCGCWHVIAMVLLVVSVLL